MPKKVMFIKPALETDATWDPIRTTSYLGMWFLASKLKESGHNVKYMDEVVRNGGLSKQSLFTRKIVDDKVTQKPLNITYEEYQRIKMEDFNKLSPEEFTKKYSEYREDGSISRVIVRTGNTIEETLKEIEKERPEFVGIPLIATANYVPAVELGKAIKEKFPDIKIIYGGQHITAEPDKFLKENLWVDHIITGDAVGIIEDVIDGKITARKIEGRIEKISEFPILDPALLEGNDYPAEPTYAHTTSGRKYVDYMFSKGCFGNCDFCTAGTRNLKVKNQLLALKEEKNGIKEEADSKDKTKKLKKIDEEIKATIARGNIFKVTMSDLDKVEEQLKLFKKYGIRELIIEDDAFLYGGAEVLKPRLDLLKKYGFYWQDNGGIEFEKLNDKITELLVNYNKNGEGRITCLYIPFNPRQWNKDKSAVNSMSAKYPEHYENLKKLRKAGIYIVTTEIIGTPEQTKEIIENDIELHAQMIKAGYIDEAVTLSATLLPGTKWREDNSDLLINEGDYAAQSLFTTDHEIKAIKGGPKKLEELLIKRAKDLNEVQTAHAWGSAFPNEKEKLAEKGKEMKSEKLR